MATEAMRIYRHLYDIERQEKSRPILDRFHQWLTVNRDRTLPKSPIGLAIAYCLTHWDGLLIYLTDGRIEIDNNATERDIKPFVIARKNFLFACTPQGADSLGVHFSLVLTARFHGLEPMAYYTEMLKRLPYCVSFSDYEALLELEEHIAIESTGHRTPNYPNLTDSTLFFASGGRDVVRGSLTLQPISEKYNRFLSTTPVPK